MLEKYQQQVQDYAELKTAKVDYLAEKEGDVFTLQADGETYEADRVIVATNVQTVLLEALGLEIGVNPNIKSGKVKQVVGVNLGRRILNP